MTSLKDLFQDRVVLAMFARTKTPKLPFVFAPSPDDQALYQTFHRDEIPSEYLYQLPIPDDQKVQLESTNHQPRCFSNTREARAYARQNKKHVLQLEVQALLAESSFAPFRSRLTRNALTNLNPNVPDGVIPVVACVVMPLSLEDIHQGKKPVMQYFTQGDGGKIRVFAKDALPYNLRLENGDPPEFCDSLEPIVGKSDKGGLLQISQAFCINELGLEPNQFSTNMEVYTYVKAQ